MIEILLEGPGKNALSSTLMAGLRDRLAAAGGAPVLLTGAGEAFSAGLNLVEVAGFDDACMLTYLHLLEDTIAALFHYPGPVVAFVNGHAIAGGCVLALCCDVRVVAPRAEIKIGLTEVALGLRFPRGVLGLVRRRVAPHSLDEVVLGARVYGPEDAVRVGFVDEVGDLEVARTRLAALAAHPADAYAFNKAEIRAGVLDEPSSARHTYLHDALPAWTSPEVRARLQAFLARRKV